MVDSSFTVGGARLPRVLLTRPAGQASAEIAHLASHGIEAVSLPLLAIEPAADRQAVTRAWSELSRCSLVMFASPNAVQHFFAAKPVSANWPNSLSAAGTGPGTVAALQHAGLHAGQCLAPPGPTFDSEALWEKVLQARPWRGAHVLIVRGNGGRDELASHLGDAGAEVSFVQAYTRMPPVWTPAQRAVASEAAQAPQAHLWHFSSSEALQHLPGLMQHTDWSASRAVTTHKRIARAARDIGFGSVEHIAVPTSALVEFVKAQAL